MQKVIVSLTLITSGAAYLAFSLFQQLPQPVATAVIAEKPDKQMGGQGAVLLPATLTEKQNRLLNMAYALAKKEGFKNPEIVQSILLQETQAGGMSSYKVANPGPQAYFGPMQIKLAAALDVLKKHPDLWKRYEFHTRTDDEVKANLILNEPFNLEVGTKYLRLLQTTYGLTGRDLVNAYNRGAGGVKEVDSGTFHYAIGAEKKLAAFKIKQ